MNAPEIAVVLTTHDAFDDARANMEILRGRWTPYFARVVVLHAVIGPRPWTPYLEDHTVRVPWAASHFRGAASLLDAGTEALVAAEPDLRYAVYLAGDCWLYRPAWVRELVTEMADQELRLAAARFEVASDAHGVARRRGDPTLLPGSGLTTDFFVLDVPWAVRTGMMPLAFDDFVARFGPLLDYLQEIVLLEKYLEGRFLSAVRTDLERQRWWKDGLGSEGLRRARSALRVIDERRIDPTGGTAPPHKGHWPGIGLTTVEDPDLKRAGLRDTGLDLALGPTLRHFFAAEDLSWFNRVDG